MRVGIDIMGGDYAPESPILGSILAREQLPADVEIVFVGDQDIIQKYADDNILDISEFPIIHTSERVQMSDHPLKSFQKTPDASIFLGQKLTKVGDLDGFCSAGNTGAMLVGAVQIISSIPGVIRPAISTFIPNIDGPNGLMLDVGLNPDARPDVLYQYGVIGSLYSKLVNKIENPRVSLLNIGKEESKGNLVAKSAHQLMKDSSDFNFGGNLEANELFLDMDADVVVCDGFVGNIVLKEAEAFYRLISKKKIGNGYFEMFNFENYGGIPILGIQSPLVIGHGISNDKAIKNMILETTNVVKSGLIKNIKEALNK
jgi:phosphate acyltransferase